MLFCNVFHHLASHHLIEQSDPDFFNNKIAQPRHSYFCIQTFEPCRSFMLTLTHDALYSAENGIINSCHMLCFLKPPEKVVQVESSGTYYLYQM